MRGWDTVLPTVGAPLVNGANECFAAVKCAVTMALKELLRVRGWYRAAYL